jgi:hypothetical protein
VRGLVARQILLKNAGFSRVLSLHGGWVVAGWFIKVLADALYWKLIKRHGRPCNF